MAKFKVGDEVDVVGTRMRNKIVSKVLFDHGVSSEYELKGVPMVRYQESMLTPALNPRNSCASTNPVVQNALAACNGTTADWKVGDRIKEKASGDTGTVRSIKGQHYFISWDDKEKYNPKRKDGTLAVVKYGIPFGAEWRWEVINSAVAANAGVRVGLQKLLHSLSKAKTDIGASLGKFNEEDWGDELAWAQKVNRACDDVARAINNAVRTLGS